MHWLHLADDSIDCFTTLKECRAERREKDGPVVRECQAQKGVAWCTMVGRKQRCFGYPHFCAEFRAYAAGMGGESSQCTEVLTKK